MKSMAYAITTIDNPFDPFTQFDAWYRFDLNRELTHRDELYVNCCSILDRYSILTDSMSESEQNEAIERAIDEIIKYDVNNVYVKVKREVDEVSDVEPDVSIDFIASGSKFLNK